jgi:4-amino-4-deoxy-L-arabinose transferase-like glycosyltransferase
MFRKLDHRAGHYLLLTAIWVIVCLPNLGGPSLWDIDEGNNAECFREMRDAGNLIVPTFNYVLREDKPALLYWCQIASAELFGIDETAARFPSVLAALLAVLSVYEMGRLMFSARTALLAGVILATSVGLLGAAHFANPDALLLCFSTLFLTFFWHDYQRASAGSSRGWLVAAGAVAGLAVLAKGPVGLVLPGAVIVFFLAWQRQLGRLWDARLAALILAFVVVAAPWYIWVGTETKGAWLRGFLEKHNVQRALEPMEGHSGGPWYYVVVLLAGLAPWSIFLGPTAWQAYKELRSKEAAREDERPALRFLVSYLAIYLIFFSVVKTKLPNYILPAYPALALLTANMLERWRRGEIALPAWLARTSLAYLALLGIGLACGLLLASGMVELSALRGRSFPDLAAWAWLGLIPMTAAAAGAWLLRRDRRGGTILAVACSAVLTTAPLAGWGLLAMEPYKASRALAHALPGAQLQRDVRLATYGYFQPSLVFYCRREVSRLLTEENAAAFLQRPLPAFLFVPETLWEQLRQRVPDSIHVLAKHTDLYSGKTVVLVSNEQPG